MAWIMANFHSHCQVHEEVLLVDFEARHPFLRLQRTTYWTGIIGVGCESHRKARRLVKRDLCGFRPISRDRSHLDVPAPAEESRVSIRAKSNSKSTYPGLIQHFVQSTNIEYSTIAAFLHFQI